MGISELTDPDAVVRAIGEFDKLGRDEFLGRYSFGKARDYFLFHGGKYYDSKAIVGVAWAYQFPEVGPLGPGDFSGGEHTVQRSLQRLGFEVVQVSSPERASRDALVLVENESTAGGEYDHWDDETGVRYQYPNNYKNRIWPGRQFVYYRGVRRRDGRRGEPEYFGSGQIGEVWRDPSVPGDAPKKDWRWFCSLEDYVPFADAVPARANGNPRFEDIQDNIGWRNGVRVIPESSFRQILVEGGVACDSDSAPVDSLLTGPPLGDVHAQQRNTLESMLRPTKRPVPRTARGTQQSRQPRRSRHAKLVGDRAEQIALRWLRENLPANLVDGLRWVAAAGETPGWDIEYLDENGEIVAIEVKGTTGMFFTSFEMTDNEWSQAEELRNRYVLVLVSECFTPKPSLLQLRDPWGLAEQGELRASTATWRLSMGENV